MSPTLAVLASCACLLGLAFADDHVLTYAGDNHVVDFAGGQVRAFDMRSSVAKDDMCDALVFPPLVSGVKFIDAMTVGMSPSDVYLTYLGQSSFLVQDASRGLFQVRRCAGFVPQLSQLPCEVHLTGTSSALLGSGRMFYAGGSRAILFNSESKQLSMHFFDADVHGGAWPFGSNPVFSGSFTELSGQVSFAYAKAGDIELLAGLESESGVFKVWRYDSTAKSVQGMFAQLLVDGQAQPGFVVKTLNSDKVLIQAVSGPTYEIWRGEASANGLVLEVLKSDSLEAGHPCVIHNRYDCVMEEGCGWCADSLRCLQIDSNRKPCDGTLCSNIVDRTSPENVINQSYESPIPGMVGPSSSSDSTYQKVFDPLDNSAAAAPARGTTTSPHDATPLGRLSDLDAEEIEHGGMVNPSEGIVYVPPTTSNSSEHRMQYVTGETSLPTRPVGQAVMNSAQGQVPVVGVTSPTGDEQVTPQNEGLVDVKLPVAINVTKQGAVAAPADVVSSNGPFVPPESKAGKGPAFTPNDGTAREEDMMNRVESAHASLKAKDSNMAVETDSVAPPEAPSQATKRVMQYKPREITPKYVPRSPVVEQGPESLVPEFFTSSAMERGMVPKVAKSVSGSTIQRAMTNAQFKSANMLKPPHQSPSEVTLVHQNDMTGAGTLEGPNSLPNDRDNTHDAEDGWKFPDQPLPSANSAVPITFDNPN